MGVAISRINGRRRGAGHIDFTRISGAATFFGMLDRHLECYVRSPARRRMPHLKLRLDAEHGAKLMLGRSEYRRQTTPPKFLGAGDMAIWSPRPYSGAPDDARPSMLAEGGDDRGRYYSACARLRAGHFNTHAAYFRRCTRLRASGDDRMSRIFAMRFLAYPRQPQGTKVRFRWHDWGQAMSFAAPATSVIDDDSYASGISAACILYRPARMRKSAKTPV